jgi:hypothetical protein
VDAVCNFIIMVGLGLSAYVRLDVALFVLLGYFMLCMYVFLYNHVSGTFQLTFMAMGPTELRIGLIVINCWMFFAGPSKVQVGESVFSAYDIVLSGVAVLFVCLFMINMVKVMMKLRREDRLPDHRGARLGGPLSS